MQQNVIEYLLGLITKIQNGEVITEQFSVSAETEDITTEADNWEQHRLTGTEFIELTIKNQ